MHLNFRVISATALFYLSLVSGGVFTFHSDGVFNDLAKLSIALFGLVFLFRYPPSRVSVKFSLAFVLFFSIPLLASAFRAENFEYALYKIDAAIVGGIFSFLLAIALIDRLGLVSFYDGFIKFAFVVLVATISYKTLFGFWDRNIRFLLNGPIVFGWFMGVAAIFSVHMWRFRACSAYLFAAVVFCLAILWTQSKGPLLALFAAFFYMYFVALGHFQRIKVSAALLVAVIGLSFVDLSWLEESTRLDAFQRLLSQTIGESDYGSVGVRAEMYQQALDLFFANPAFGIGLGNWQFVTGSEFLYPHNQHLEILTEIGGFYFALYFSLVIFAFLNADSVIKSVLIFFIVAASFSGDLSYLRYVFAFSLIAVYVNCVKYEPEVI